jgi:uncharacterized delta-60 repeat protein
MKQVAIAMVSPLIVGCGLGLDTECGDECIMEILDTTFASGGTRVIGDSGRDFPLTLAVRPDGRIRIVGKRFNGSNDDAAVWALNSDGSTDTSYGGGLVSIDGSGYDEDVGRAAFLGDGTIFVPASSGTAANGEQLLIAKLNPYGALDSSFDGDGRRFHEIASGTNNDGVNALAVDPGTGSIFAAGKTYMTSNDGTAIWKFFSTGAIDSGFNAIGYTTWDDVDGNDYCAVLLRQGDGKLLCIGESLTPSFGVDVMVIRYTSAGTVDGTYGAAGWFYLNRTGDEESLGAILMPDGGALIAAAVDKVSSPKIALIKLTPAGALDPGFGSGGIAIHDGAGGGSGEEFAVGLLQLPNGKILVAGAADDPGAGAESLDPFVWRFYSNGALDTDFNGGRGYFELPCPFGYDGYDFAAGLAMQPDGKVVVAGACSSGAGESYMEGVVWRLNPM